MDSATSSDIVREFTRAKNILLEVHILLAEKKYPPEYVDIAYALHLQAKDVIRHLLLDIEKEQYDRKDGQNVTETMETHQKAPLVACFGLGKGQGTTGATKEQDGGIASQIAPTPCTH